MPRPLAEYDAADWRRLRPLTHAYKTWRYDRVTDAYARRAPRAGDLAALQARFASQRLLVTVAFNDVDILQRQLRAMRRFVGDVPHLVADNSNDDARAAAIATACEAAGTPYLRLPANPWGLPSASRSHGLAMNWLWRRLIRPSRPTMFGFLDHDLVPVAPCDPFEPLTRQPVGGDKRWVDARWYLWAGYCLFRTEFLDGLRVDFGQDWFIGLDTGGGNWRSIYSKLDPDSIEERPIVRIAALPDRPVTDCYIERRGAWLHEVGFAGLPDLKAAKRARFLAMVDAALEQ